MDDIWTIVALPYIVCVAYLFLLELNQSSVFTQPPFLNELWMAVNSLYGSPPIYHPYILQSNIAQHLAAFTTSPIDPNVMVKEHPVSHSHTHKYTHYTPLHATFVLANDRRKDSGCS